MLNVREEEVNVYRWRSSKNAINREIFVQKCRLVADLVAQQQSNYYNDIINRCGSDQKALFSVITKLTKSRSSLTFPTREDDELLAEEFAEFFAGKVCDIRESIPKNVVFPDIPSVVPVTKKLIEFLSLSHKEVQTMMSKAPSKTCSLDPIPTWLLKLCAPVLVPAITTIINASLTQGIMPDNLKSAIINPLLKKPHLDNEQLKHFRKVSMLAFVSKLIERAVAMQLTHHMTINNTSDMLQSSYKQHHSTETAMLKVHSDILTSLDQHGAVLMVLLDLSSAFDTVDHNLLLQILKERIGVSGTALQWFSSYLSERTETVLVKGCTSLKRKINTGVPQGSVLGPILFTIYTIGLGDTIHKHDVDYHLYADDTQLYLKLMPSIVGNAEATLQRMESCINDIRNWTAMHFLKINEDKTEAVVFSSKYDTQPTLHCVQVGDEEIKISHTIRNLGVMMEENLTGEAQVNAAVKAAFFHIRQLGQIRHFLSDEAAASVVHAFITSRLDYCNSLYINLPSSITNKLQRVQNIAARIVTKSSRYAHITPILQELHWLPIQQRVQYKVLLLTYKALHDLAPTYIVNMVQRQTPQRCLRSSKKLLLKIPAARLKSYGERTFQFCAPRLWNQLPSQIQCSENIASFKRQLKTKLFKEAFNV